MESYQLKFLIQAVLTMLPQHQQICRGGWWCRIQNAWCVVVRETPCQVIKFSGCLTTWVEYTYRHNKVLEVIEAAVKETGLQGGGGENQEKDSWGVRIPPKRWWSLSWDHYLVLIDGKVLLLGGADSALKRGNWGGTPEAIGNPTNDEFAMELRKNGIVHATKCCLFSWISRAF